MVFIKTFTTTGITQLSNTAGHVVYDSVENVLKYNNASRFANLLVTNADGGLGGIVDFTASTVTSTSTTASTSSILGAVKFSGGLSIAKTTDATDSTNGGSITTAGGVAIGKSLYIGTNLTLAGTNASISLSDVGSTVTLSGTTATTSNTTGTLKMAGGIGISNATDASSATNGGTLTTAGGAAFAKQVFIGTNLTLSGASSILSLSGASSSISVTGTTASTSNSTGTLKLAGGIGISNSTDATDATNGGTITTAGGVAIAKQVFIGTNLTLSGASSILSLSGASSSISISGTTATTSNSTGTLKIAGGIGISNSTDATDATNGGTITTAGGAAIAKKLFVGGNLTMSGVDTILSLSDDGSSMTISGLTDATDSATGGTLTVSGGAAIAKKLYVGSNLTMSGVDAVLSLSDDGSSMTISGTTDASSSTVGGTLTISGGAAIAKKLYVGTSLYVNGTEISATQAAYLTGITPGICTASKALVVDANRSIVNIGYIESAEAVFIKSNTANNTPDYPISLTVLPSTGAVNGLGTGLEFNSVNDNGDIYNAGYINYISSDVTANSESGYLEFRLANDGVIDNIFTVANNGVLTAVSFVETSDRRVKENIQNTDSVNSLDKILKLNVKTYNFIKDKTKKTHMGLIAQEVEEIIPEIVETSNKDGLADFKAIHYTELIGYLINCVKELKKELDDLKNLL